MTEYDPGDVSTWADEQRRAALEKTLANMPEGWDEGPIIAMGAEELQHFKETGEMPEPIEGLRFGEGEVARP